MVSGVRFQVYLSWFKGSEVSYQKTDVKNKSRVGLRADL